MHRRSTARRGFTLIEVLLVIVILGLLAGAAVFMLTGTGEKAKKDVTRTKLQNILKQVKLYHMHMGAYPDEEEGLTLLLSRPEDEELAEKWAGPYLEASKDPLTDAWGNDVVYRLAEDPDAGTRYPTIYSFGPNGEDDSGEGDDIQVGGVPTTDEGV